MYVGRGSFWANPFLSARFGHARSTGLHRAWLQGRLSFRALILLGFNEREIMALGRLRSHQLARIDQLTGKDLICWCPLKSRWCHADELIALAAVGISRMAA